ncbi:DUF448 domain-containing protein [Roseomonas aeriglobus]|nr:DUF448 domain-containing protein [Roseomonas aeriglobus]
MNDRTCILSRDSGPREGLMPFPPTVTSPDVRAKAPGRGAWIGVTRAELETAIANGKLSRARAFKGAPLSIPTDLPARIATQLERAALDRLGLEAKAGHLLIGAERIETAAQRPAAPPAPRARRAPRWGGQAGTGVARRVGSRRLDPQGLGFAGDTHHIVRGIGPRGTCWPDGRPGGQAGARRADPLAAFYRTRTCR